MEKCSKKMALIDEMQDGIAKLSGPRHWSDTRQSWLARGARLAGISYRAAKALFYRERPDPRASVVDRVRAAVEKRDHQEQEQDRNDYQDILQRIAVLERRLETIDPEFFSEAISSLHAATSRKSDRPT